MRILLDESLPKKLGFLLSNHFVRTVVQMNWSGLVNGELLRTAAPHFDVLISGDRNMQYQQNEVLLPMSVVTLIAQNNRLESFLPLIPGLLETLDKLEANRFYQICT
jgi:predicted nuclease of predicted toxin-antitoxin system